MSFDDLINAFSVLDSYNIDINNPDTNNKSLQIDIQSYLDIINQWTISSTVILDCVNLLSKFGFEAKKVRYMIANLLCKQIPSNWRFLTPESQVYVRDILIDQIYGYGDEKNVFDVIVIAISEIAVYE